MSPFLDHGPNKSPHSQATTSKTLEAFVRLTTAKRQAIIELPRSIAFQCFPEGIEKEDFVASKKELVAEGKVGKGKKTRARKALNQS